MPRVTLPHKLKLSWQSSCDSWQSPTSPPAPCYGWWLSTKTSFLSYRDCRPLVPTTSSGSHCYPFTTSLSSLVQENKKWEGLQPLSPNDVFLKRWWTTWVEIGSFQEPDLERLLMFGSSFSPHHRQHCLTPSSILKCPFSVVWRKWEAWSSVRRGLLGAGAGVRAACPLVAAGTKQLVAERTALVTFWAEFMIWLILLGYKLIRPKRVLTEKLLFQRDCCRKWSCLPTH